MYVFVYEAQKTIVVSYANVGLWSPITSYEYDKPYLLELEWESINKWVNNCRAASARSTGNTATESTAKPQSWRARWASGHGVIVQAQAVAKNQPRYRSFHMGVS